MDDDLRYLLDRRAIDDLMTRYATAVDSHDWALLDTVFTPDARLDYRTAGGPAGPYPEIKAWLEASVPGMAVMHHIVPNSNVTIAGDTATATSNFIDSNMAMLPAGPHVFFVGGYYHDELVRTPDGWRITKRVEETLFWDRPLPGMPAVPLPLAD